MRAAVPAAAFLALSIALAPAGAFAKGQVDLIVVEKTKRVMTLYARKKVLKTYRIALGSNPAGHKEQEGDSRTPEGRYTIDWKNPQSLFHLSLHVSYPSRKDQTSASKRGVPPGGAIMVHGTPESIASLHDAGIYPDWTLGCIAVKNSEMDEIFKLVGVGTTIWIKP